MLFLFRVVPLIAILISLTSCASPRYQTLYRYEPPTDATGRACLEKCENKLASCQSSCSITFQSCSKSIEPEAEAQYSEALKRYEMELNRYRWELQRYELNQSLNWEYHSLAAGHWHYSPWPRPYYFPPTPPRKPSRDDALARLRKLKCDSDCGCQPIYDACFLSCGGKKIPEVRCIANCPKDK